MQTSASLGIDVGSVAVKAVLVADGVPAAWREEPTRPDTRSQCAALVRAVLDDRGLGVPDAGAVCATGYGRQLVDADRRANEIMANAVGAAWMQRHWADLGRVFGGSPSPERLEGPFRTIIDVGGQDSKVIVLDADGLVRDFAMNDRCAAGTGRFLEVMARVLEVDLDRLAELAAGAQAPAVITSACTVFAESEVISRLAEGASRQDVAAGVFESVADQVAGLAARCGWQAPVLFDGGASRSIALRRALARRLGCDPAAAPCGQFTTALGAACLAWEASGGRGRAGRRG